MSPMGRAMLIWASAKVATKVHREWKQWQINNALRKHCKQEGECRGAWENLWSESRQWAIVFDDWSEDTAIYQDGRYEQEEKLRGDEFKSISISIA